MYTIGSLTETEIDELVQKLCETIASQQVWQCSRNSSLYRLEGDLIMLLKIYYSDRKNGLFVSLSYKIYADDEIFWKILEIEYEDQSKQEARIHSAFKAPFLPVSEDVLEIDDWAPENLQTLFEPTLSTIEKTACNLIAEIQTEQNHLNRIDHFIEEYYREHPKSTTSTPYDLQILSAIRNSHWSTAEMVIRQRLALGLGSGVGTKKGTFYELAYQYLHSKGLTSPEEAPMVFVSRARRPNFQAFENSVTEMMRSAIDNFGENDESVYWVEIYLLDIDADRLENTINIFGAWLGQYLVRQLDGDWGKTALSWGVSVGSSKIFYPYIQVEKYLRFGQSESLCDFVNEVRKMARER